MDGGYCFLVVAMRVGVIFARLAVGCPTRMTYAAEALYSFAAVGHIA